VKWTSEPIRVGVKGATLVSVRAPVGDANIADRDYCIGRGLAALVPGPSLDGEFLFYWIVKSKRDLESAIPVLGLAEQRAIAYVLRTVQRAREQTEQVRDALDVLFASLLCELVTGRLRVDQLATEFA
jgi:type I restriction enzyme S subunit